jgi:group II intron reverse transcriptase/maturase
MAVKPKAHSLTGRITPELMRKAFLRVKRNRGAAGIDKQSVKMFEANLEQNLDALMRGLKQRTFVPMPARRTYIPKGKGKFRPLGIPAVRDRVAQEVLRQLLSPIFEVLFHDDSFGFREGRNCHQAVGRVLEIWHQGYRHVLDADIKGFFDNIPHSVIMTGLSAVVADGNILGLIEKFLRAGIMENGGDIAFVGKHRPQFPRLASGETRHSLCAICRRFCCALPVGKPGERGTD